MARSGRYCWSCGRARPNERFSRRSGLRGVCVECYRLGPAELAYRQAVAHIDRSLRHEDVIPTRHRTMIEGMLQNPHERIRTYAAAVIERDARVRRDFADARRADFEVGSDMIAAPSIGTDESEDLPF